MTRYDEKSIELMNDSRPPLFIHTAAVLRPSYVDNASTLYHLGCQWVAMSESLLDFLRSPGIRLSNLCYKVLCSIGDMLEMTAISLRTDANYAVEKEGKPAGSVNNCAGYTQAEGRRRGCGAPSRP
jgi:hypothetical protein